MTLETNFFFYILWVKPLFKMYLLPGINNIIKDKELTAQDICHSFTDLHGTSDKFSFLKNYEWGTIPLLPKFDKNSINECQCYKNF